MIGSVVTPVLSASLTTPALAQTQSESKAEVERLLNLCQERLDKWQIESAVEPCQQAVSASQKIKERPSEAKSMSNLGSAYLSNGQPSQAISPLETAIRIAREIGDRRIEADALQRLGVAYFFLGQSQQGTEFMQQALAIAQVIGQVFGETKLVREIQRNLSLFEKELTSPQAIEAYRLFHKGMGQFEISQYREALQSWHKALDLYRKTGNRQKEADSLNNLGNAYSLLGQYQSAIDYYQQSLAIEREIGNRNGEASSLVNLGSVYVSLGQYQSAIDYYQQSLSILQEIGDRKGEAGSLNNLGIAYFSLGQYPKAIDYFQQSVAIFKNIGDRRGQNYSLANLGTVYQSLGQYQSAINYYQQSLSILQEIGDRNGQAFSLMGLGVAYLSLGQYQSAINYYQQSLSILQEIGNRNGQALSLMGLGVAYGYLKQYSKAIDHFQQSLSIQQKIGDRKREAGSLLLLGHAYGALEQYPKTIDYFEQSLSIQQEIGDRVGEGVTLSSLGYLYKQQEQPELAIVFYKQSVNIREGIRQDIRVLEKELQESYTETVAGTYRSLADLLLSQDRIYEAQQVLELLKLQEIQDFTRSQRARGDLPKVVLLPQEQEIIDSYGKLVAFAAEIAQCEQTNCLQLSTLRDRRDTLKRQYNQDVRTLETAIRKRTYQDEQFLLPTSFNRTADRIIQASDTYNTEPGTAVIYPLVLKDKLWLLWAAKGKVIGKREITNVGRKQLNREVLKLRFFLQDPNTDVAQLQKTAQQLYDWLIKPIEGELEAGNIHHLDFSLDRGFRYIPMAVLHDGEKYLIEKYTITTFISAEFTDTENRLPTKLEETPIIGVGASEFSGYKPLPHVITEIDSIVREDLPHDQQGIYPGNQFLNEAFTFSTLRDNLTGRKLLHIATHGKFVPGNQYDSFLVLGDGEKLNIPDIQILDDYLDDVHLVVLSACETALGDSFLTDPKQEEGIEINALSFYFLSGGAKAVMASLWRVDDTSTSLLMQRFYCTLANENPPITKAQALKKAQLSLLKNTPLDCEQSAAERADFTHPHYWAPFILIGNGLWILR